MNNKMHFINLLKAEEFENNSSEFNQRNLKKRINKEKNNNYINNNVICLNKFTNKKQESFIEDKQKIFQYKNNSQNYILLKKNKEIHFNKNSKENKDEKDINNMVIIKNKKFHENFSNFEKDNMVMQHLENDKANKSKKNFVHPFDSLNYGKNSNIIREYKREKETNCYCNLIKTKNKFNNLPKEKHSDKVTSNFCDNDLNKTLDDFFKNHFIHKKNCSNENYENFYNSNNILSDSVSKNIKQNKFYYLYTLFCNSLDENTSRNILSRENEKKKKNFNTNKFKFISNTDSELYSNTCKIFKKLNDSKFSFRKKIMKNNTNIKIVNSFSNNIITLNEGNVDKIGKYYLLYFGENFDFDLSLKFLNNSKVSKNRKVFKNTKTKEGDKTFKDGVSIRFKREEELTEPLFNVEKKNNKNIEYSKIKDSIKRIIVKKSKIDNKKNNQKDYKIKTNPRKQENGIKKEETYNMYNAKKITMEHEKKVDINKSDKTENEVSKKIIRKIKIYNSMEEKEFIGEKKIIESNKMKNKILYENLKIKEKKHCNILNNYSNKFCCKDNEEIKRERNIKSMIKNLGVHSSKENIFEFNNRIKFNYIYADNLSKTNFTSEKSTNNNSVYKEKSVNNSTFIENKKNKFYLKLDDSIKNKKNKLLKINLGKMKNMEGRSSGDAPNKGILIKKEIKNKTVDEKKSSFSNKYEKIKIYKRLCNFKKLIKVVKKCIYINTMIKMKKKRYALKDIHFLRKYLHNFSKSKKIINKKEGSKIVPLKNLHTMDNSTLNKSYINKKYIKVYDQSNLKTKDKVFTMKETEKKIIKEKSSVKNLNDAECKIYILLEKFSNEHKTRRMK